MIHFDISFLILMSHSYIHIVSVKFFAPFLSRESIIKIVFVFRQCHIFSIDKLHNTKTEIGSTLGDLQNPLGARFRKRYVQLFDKYVFYNL